MQKVGQNDRGTEFWGGPPVRGSAKEVRGREGAMEGGRGEEEEEEEEEDKEEEAEDEEEEKEVGRKEKQNLHLGVRKNQGLHWRLFIYRFLRFIKI